MCVFVSEREEEREKGRERGGREREGKKCASYDKSPLVSLCGEVGRYRQWAYMGINIPQRVYTPVFVFEFS